jgi:hypothetical protein
MQFRESLGLTFFFVLTFRLMSTLKLVWFVISLKELRLYTDYGRCSRPLFIVENQRLLIKKAHIRALQQRV